MTTRLHRPALTPGPARTLRVRPSVIVMRTLAALTAALFAIDAYVHFDDAHDYDFPRGASITQGDLFRVQASIAIVVAIALLIRPHWAVWILAILIAGSAAGAVFLYTYVNVGRLGPLPNCTSRPGICRASSGLPWPSRSRRRSRWPAWGRRSMSGGRGRSRDGT